MTAGMRQPRAAAPVVSGAGAARARLTADPLCSSLELGTCPEAAAAARGHARAVLAEWGLAELAGEAELVVSELVTNAVQAHQREGLDAAIHLMLVAGLLADPRTVRIVVRDAAGGVPALASPGGAGENGRGLVIVAALSAGWGSRPCPGGGKIVQALLEAPRPPRRARDGT